MLSLDSLVDIVSNNVGILIVLAAFVALLALVNPGAQQDATSSASRTERPQKRLEVPWSHATNKNTVFFHVADERVQHLDLRAFYAQLAGRRPGREPQTVTVNMPELSVRFFPVTNQVYCLELRPEAGSGEPWPQAEQEGSAWRSVLADYPPERYVYFFWVTGDSFAVFREMRDWLQARNHEVGWKPARAKEPLELCNGFEGAQSFQPQ